MAEYILINENWIKDYTPLTKAVDPNLMKQSALTMQDMYIAPRLGDALLRECKTQAEAGTLSGYYATLVNDYLRKALTWYTTYDLLPRLYVRYDNGGPQIHISDETNQIEQVDLQREVADALEKAQFYTKRMVDWLCVNGSNMPEYTSNTAPDRSPTAAQVFSQSGMTFSQGKRNYG